ncbi:alpha/beta fold hydrolase [Nonomuraea composti]|uniref:alpha/beta fold hydrolase n=1 Tax=Nonomuraea composti TaxID=2720023 RepID=UPI00197D186A
MFGHDGTPVRTSRAAVNGTSLHDRTAGSGPAVVLLHGVPKTGCHWRHLVPKLTPHYTVIVPDLRGLGDSARPAGGYDSATMSDDIAALMSALGHERYAVIGEDWGAVIRYQLAARHREHVTALVFAEALFPGFGAAEAGHPRAGARRFGVHRRAQRVTDAAHDPRRHRSRLRRRPRPRRGGARRDGRRRPAVPGGAVGSRRLSATPHGPPS